MKNDTQIQVATENIRSEIAAAFQRSASAEAKNIEVEVVGTKVILKGKVKSFVEQDAATKAALATPGVAVVESKLEIEEEEYPYTG